MSSPQTQAQPQTPDARKVGSDGEDFSDTVNEITNFEYSDANKTATSSSHQDSEYDTASDSQSSDEADLRNRRDSGSILDNDDEIPASRARKLSCDDTNDADGEVGDDEYDVRTDDDSESGSIVLDLERQRGDGEEEHDEESKKVDDDEDRSNPQYIPKRGVFYEHDDRTADDVEEKDDENEEPAEVKKPPKKTADRWAHDFYDESEQAPKSRAELVNSYGYDIRNEDGPPKTRRNRRYNRGPIKYERRWEDESAYSKPRVVQTRNPRPEDFPELGSKVDRRAKNIQVDREEKENKSRQNQMPDEERSYPGRRRSLNRQQNERDHERDHERVENSRRKPQQQQQQQQQQHHHHQQQQQQHHHHHQQQREQQHSGYSSNRSGRDSHSDDRRMSRDKNYRTGRNTMNSIVIKNQNRNKPNENFEMRGGHNRNNSGSNLDKRNLADDEHVESISFTNSKLNNNNHSTSSSRSGRHSSSNGKIAYGFDVEQQMQNPSHSVQQQQQQQQAGGQQQSQSQTLPMQQQQQQQQPGVQQTQPPQQRFQLVSNEMSINLEGGSQMANQQNSQNVNLGPNHPIPIASAAATSGLTQVQQQEIVGSGANSLKSHVTKRYSNQRNRTAIEPQAQPQSQTQQLPMNVVPQPQAAQAQVQQSQPGVVPNVAATQYQQTYFANEYPTINPPQTPATYGQPAFIGFPSEMAQQPSGSAYIQQGAPPQPAPVGVVPQMMNFVPAHPPIQAPPVVQPVPNAQNQYPSYPYAGVQNYNSASGITYYAPQTQPPPRPILSQRRHTNAIPIMAPPERSNKHSHGSRSAGSNSGNPNDGNNNNGDQQQNQQNESATENIDHILDNMFVQRPHPYQPATGMGDPAARKSLTPPIEVQKSHGIEVIESQEKANIDLGSASVQQDENEKTTSSLAAMSIQ